LTLSLDTNVLIELLQDRAPTIRAAFGRALSAGDEMVVSVLVAHELRFGARLSRRNVEIRAAEALLGRLPIIPFTEADAEGATRVRLGLERIGRRIGAMDMLIAGQAIARGWSVVTANTHEFDRVARLRVVDWTSPSQRA